MKGIHLARFWFCIFENSFRSMVRAGYIFCPTI